MQTGTLVALALYFVLMLAIGLYAWRKSTDSSEGYLLAGRNLHPAVAALPSGSATDRDIRITFSVPARRDAPPL